jgi:primosomal protein N' (replication factor Y) (superfamily II helicase)
LIQYADVVVDLPLESEVLTYTIPDKMKSAERGCRVEVEVRGRKLIGIIRDVHFNEPRFTSKPLLKLVDTKSIITEEQWDIADWMKSTYIAGLGESIFRMIPQGRRLIREEKPDLDIDTEFKTLNPEQELAYKSMATDLGNKHSSHLLYGITGSGKTEVYIHLMRDVIENTDRSVIFLVPEISLTYHVIQKLEKIFPKDLALLHSALKTSQRFRAYQALLQGEKRIAVGTRSAIFAPVSKPALIILDEEHDSSYKENTSPRYHTRQVAHFRAKSSNGVLLLGSATPSIETFFLAKSGRIHFHPLKNRAVTDASLPDVKIIAKKDGEGAVGFDLMRELKIQKKNKEQSVLLLNRRGYSPLIYSGEEKKFLGCPNCSTNLCYHKVGIAQCHICGYKESFEKLKTTHKTLELVGTGTQKLEEFLLANLPDTKIERLDQDSSRKPEVLAGVLSRLYHGELDILTGTQMIAKGLDVPNVTLVGVINANQGLGVPDFRAAERVFSLLTQVAGRAGRSKKKGRVYIEASDSNHPVLIKAMNQDYDGFYNEEIQFRRQMLLPPFSRLLRLVIRSTEEEISALEIQKIATIIQERKYPEIQIMGPSPCPFFKLDKYFRHHILIKSNNHEFTRPIVKDIHSNWKAGKNVYLEVDFDPLDLV